MKSMKTERNENVEIKRQENESTGACGCRNLTFRYLEQNKKNILNNVSVNFPKGKITVLMGRSGCGKSTLAALLAGLYPENGGVLKEGEIYLFGRPLSDYTIPERAGRLSVMFQNADLQFCMETLRKEMIFCLENVSCPREEMEERILRAAEASGMTSYLDRKFLTLSGGEKQKAALACIFLLQEESSEGVILLDEPFANIDGEWAEKIVSELQKLNQKRKTTIIAIDHALDHWMGKADEIMVMDQNGQICDTFPTADLPEKERLFQREGLRWPFEKPRRIPNDIEMVAKKGSKASIRLEHTTIYAGKKGFHRHPVSVARADDISFYPGQMTAVLGSSGAGKTTFFRTLLRKQYYEGNIWLRNSKEKEEELSNIRPNRLYEKIGIVFQNPSNQFVTQNVLQEVETGIEGRIVHPEDIKGSETESQALELLKEFHLERFQRYSPFMLSQGQQRRLAVLSILAGRQKILLLDEPTYGQDDEMTREIMTLLSKRMERENLTILFSTHDTRLVRDWADRCVIIRNRKMKEGTDL